MKINFKKHKKLIIASLGLIIGSIICIPFLFNDSKDKETVREREYPVTRDKITVGIDSSGEINTIPNIHTFAEKTVIDEIYVKAGSEVKKGDKLGKISLKNLKELIESGKDEVSDAKSALLKAQSEKNVFLQENAKNKKSNIQGVQEDYSNKLEILNSEKTRIEKSMLNFKNKLVEIENKMNNLSPEAQEIREKVAKLKEQMNENIIKLGQLKEDLYKVNDGSDKRTDLNEKISKEQDNLADLKDALARKIAESENDQSRIKKLELEIENNNSTIARLQEQLKNTADEAERESITSQIESLRELNASIDRQLDGLMDRQRINDIQSSIREREKNISKLQNEVQLIPDGSKETNELNLKSTKIQNENTVLQQEIDRLMENTAAKDLEKLLTDQSAHQEALEKEELALSIKIEEIQRAEKMAKNELQKQNNENTFSDYKTSEQVKSMNENIAKASRNVTHSERKLNILYDLQKTPILYAQMDGVVNALNYKVGETILQEKPFCLIGELKEIILSIPVDAADIGTISIGQNVNIYLDAFSEKQFSGKVVERLLVANSNGDYEVMVSIDPEDYMLLPGMKAFATIIVKEKTDILTISNKAIYIEEGVQYVNLKNENGDLIKTKIATGFSDGRVSEILDGLSENDVAIIQE